MPPPRKVLRLTKHSEAKKRVKVTLAGAVRDPQLAEMVTYERFAEGEPLYSFMEKRDIIREWSSSTTKTKWNPKEETAKTPYFTEGEYEPIKPGHFNTRKHLQMSFLKEKLESQQKSVVKQALESQIQLLRDNLTELRRSEPRKSTRIAYPRAAQLFKPASRNDSLNMTSHNTHRTQTLVRELPMPPKTPLSKSMSHRQSLDHLKKPKFMDILRNLRKEAEMPLFKRHFENPAKKQVDQQYVSVRHSPIRLLNYLSSSSQNLIKDPPTVPPQDLYLKVY